MESLISEILDKKIKYVQKKEEVYGIILVGSNANKNRDVPADNSDIDIFVITKKGKFRREVGYFEGVEFDVSYINIDELKSGIEKKIPSLVTIISKSEKLFGENEISQMIKMANDIFVEGPDKPSQYEIDYNRFVLTGNLEQLRKRIEQPEFCILYGTLLKDAIRFYYKTEGIWMPPDKRLLKFIQDSNILNILNIINTTDNRNTKMVLIDELLSLVLEKHGGELRHWNLGFYPLDFK